MCKLRYTCEISAVVNNSMVDTEKIYAHEEWTLRVLGEPMDKADIKELSDRLTLLGHDVEVIENAGLNVVIDNECITVSSPLGMQITGECSKLFSRMDYLEVIDLSCVQVSPTRCDYMFNLCNKLNYVDISTWDTSKVENTKAMFYMCEGLETLDLSSFNFSKVTDIHDMLYGCKNLKELTLGDFNLDPSVDTYNMVYNCSSLKLDKIKCNSGLDKILSRNIVAL